MKQRMFQYFALVGALALVLLAVACGDEAMASEPLVDDQANFLLGAGAMIAIKDSPGLPASTPPPLPAVAPTPAPLPPPAGLRGPSLPKGADEAVVQGSFDSNEEDEGTSTQGRLIVRTVDMALEVLDVSQTLEDIATLAADVGGWVIQSRRREVHRGFVSIRVPVDRVDGTVARLRELALEVRSEISNSRDVTDEYVDNQASLVNLRAAEEQLIKLMERAGSVQELLEVQREVTRVRGDIERLQGRIKLLEETSAFSLMNVSLQLAPAMIEVDAGLDLTLGESEYARFRATFVPPEGITEFRYEWDFGDGSGVLVSTRTAPSADGSSRVTATVTHAYHDRTDSPFIATIKLTGTGETGAAEGEDTVIVDVTSVPKIEVFAGPDQTAGEGKAVVFNGSFTRPEGMASVSFRWDFGDGSSPVTGDLDSSNTTATASHVYPNHRPMPFTATLTVSGTGDTGTMTGSGILRVAVLETEEWAAGNVAGGAASALASAGKGLAHGGIWLGIFSPFWASGLLVVGYLVWLRRRPKASNQPGG